MACSCNLCVLASAVLVPVTEHKVGAVLLQKHWNIAVVADDNGSLGPLVTLSMSDSHTGSALILQAMFGLTRTRLVVHVLACSQCMMLYTAVRTAHLSDQQACEEVGQAPKLRPAEQDVQVQAHSVRVVQRVLAVLHDVLPEGASLNGAAVKLLDLVRIVDLIRSLDEPAAQPS